MQYYCCRGGRGERRRQISFHRTSRFNYHKRNLKTGLSTDILYMHFFLSAYADG
jgi:hypothetical protein